MNFILHLLDILIPRFVTNEVACIRVGDSQYKAVSHIDLLSDDDEFDSICVIKSFNLLGYPLFSSTELYEVVDG